MRFQRRPVISSLLILLLIVLAALVYQWKPWLGNSDTVPSSAPPSSVIWSPDSVPNPTGLATQALGKLPQKGRAPKTGYHRDEFGPSWQDVDGNGCDTRNDVLARDLKEVTFRPGTHNCVVQSGTLDDPYTGERIAFLRGPETSPLVQIDHVVSLSNAWQTGAFAWDSSKRLAFANDPLNLLAVDGRANQNKGAGDAATWLPPNKSYRCAYVARQVAVKTKYGLWVSAPEAEAMERILSKCPSQTLPEP